MHSIAMAMAWEYWRKARRRIVATILFSGLFLVLFPFHEQLTVQLVSQAPFVLVMAMVAVTGFIVVELTELDTRRDRLGFPQHLYTKPVPTSIAVALRMLLSAMVVSGIYLALDLLVWALSGAGLPLLAPILFMTLMAAWTDAAIWALSGSPFLQVIGMVVGYILCVTLCARPFVEGEALPHSVSFIPWICAVGLAYVVAVLGVGFDRRGDRISLARVVAWLSDRVYSAHRADRPFRSATAAQFWLEWRRRGRLWPGLTLAAIITYAAIAIVAEDVSLEDGTSFIVALGTINVLVFPIFIGMAVTAKERGTSQDVFWGTRPLSDNALLWVQARVAVASMVSSWLVWLAGALVIYGLLSVTDRAEEGFIIRNGSGGYEPRVAFWGVVIAWTMLGVVGSLNRCGMAVLLAFPGLPLLVWSIAVERELLPPSWQHPISAVMPGTIAVLCMLGTVLAYRAALRSRRIGRRFALLALGVYAIGCYLVLYPEGWRRLCAAHDVDAAMVALGLGTLPFLPLALGPLAIAWHRHR